MYNRLKLNFRSNLLIFLTILMVGGHVYAHNVGQSQTSKYFSPETVKMLQDRAAGVTAGGPGIRTGDVLSYIIESVPSPNGAFLGSAGYITDYIPPGMEVVGTSFVDKVPNPTKIGGFGYVNRPANLPGILGDGCGQRGCLNSAYKTALGFFDGNIARATQDTGIFYSVDPRTVRLPQETLANPALLAPTPLAIAPIDITACTKAVPAGGAARFIVYNRWDYEQLTAFGDQGPCDTVLAFIGGAGDGNPPVYRTTAQGVVPAMYIGLSSPVAGPDTYYTNDYNPDGDLLPATVSVADYMGVGPWNRIYAPGSLIGGTGNVVPAILPGIETIAGVPTSTGWPLSTANPLPSATNAVRWAIGERTVGSVEYVKISMRVTNLGTFGTTTISGNNIAYTNHSEVFGGDASGGAQGGKDMVYAYLGPSQANNNAQLMVTKKVVAVSNIGPTGPWISSDGAFVAPLQWVKYRLNYLNAASAPLYNVVITDVIDIARVTYVSSSTGNPFIGPVTLPYTPPNLVWPAIPILSPGGGGSMEVVVQLSSAAIINALPKGSKEITSNTIKARASTSAPPVAPTYIDAQASFVSNISGIGGAIPNIVQAKTVTPSVTVPGGVVHYTITLVNNGGPIAQPAKGNPPLYPTSSVFVKKQLGPPSLIVGDKMPESAPGIKAISYLNVPPVHPLTIRLIDNNTGAPYLLNPVTDFLPLVEPGRPNDMFWEVLKYPVGYPNPATGIPFTNADIRAFSFETGTLQVDFYGQVAAAPLSGIFKNQVESYVGTWDAAKNPPKDVSKVTPNLAPVSVSSPDFTGFWKTATDINGAPTAPSDIIQYNMNATNTGLVPATSVVITDPVPVNTTFLVGTATAAPTASVLYSNNGGATYAYNPVGAAGTPDPAVTHIQYLYPTVAIGASIAPSFRVQVAPTLGNGVQILNQASLMTLETGLILPPALGAGVVFKSDDPALPGLNDQTTTIVTAQPNYTTSTKTALVNGAVNNTIIAGDTVSYTITVADTGNDAAGSSNLTVTDAIDVNVLDIASIVATVPAGWTVAGPSPSGVVSWSATTFPQGATATFTVTAIVKAGVPQGTILNNSIDITSTELPTPTLVQGPVLTVAQTTVSGYVYNGVVNNGIANVTVALQAVGSNIDTANTITDATGFYSIPAPNPGAWDVRVTDANSILSGLNLLPGFTNPLSVNLINAQTLLTQNFGYEFNGLPVLVNGKIFDDVNGDGVENLGEAGIAGVTVTLSTPTGVLLTSVTTDALGTYVFNNIAQGDYIITLSDDAGLLINRYLTTGISSPAALPGLLPGSVSTVNFGYKTGSRIGDFIFDDTNANGLFDIGEVGLPNVSIVLQQGGITKYSTTTDNTGTYLFQGVAQGTYNLVVTNPFTGVANPAVPVITVSGLDQLTLDYGFSAPPVITVSKTTASPIAGQNAAVEYTITIINTGGAANNFNIKDILPNTLPLVVPAPTYSNSSGSFLYLNTGAITLNGLPFVIPNMPINFSTSPVWSGFSMPGQSTLSLTFTAFSDAIDGTYYNGVQYRYNNGTPLDTIVNNPDLATVVVSSTGLLSKAVTSVNGMPWAGGEPVLAAGDTVTYTVTLQNTPAALIQEVTKFTETMPFGFSYVPNSTVITAPVNPVAVAPVPTQVGQVLTWNMPVLRPATLAGNAFSQITLSFDLLVGSTALAGSHTDVATASVITAGIPLPPTLPPALSTGDAAPVTVSQPILSMTKTTATPVVSRAAAGTYTPASFKITVTNKGAAPANGVTLTDVLPMGFNFATATVLINGAVQPAGTVALTQIGQTLTVDTVPAGGFSVPAKNGVTDGKLVIDYTADILPTSLSGVYVNTVNMASINGGAISGATASVELVDVQLNKTTSTPNVIQGNIAVYTIQVANNGLAPVGNVSVVDVLPSGFTYKQGSTLINGVIAADPGGTTTTPLWLLTSIAANSTASITFSVDVAATTPAGIYYNTIQATSGSGIVFPNPGLTAPVSVLEPQPSLTVLKLANNPAAKPGDIITYTVTITNTGQGQAKIVDITNVMSHYTKLALAPFPTPNISPFSFADGANPSGLPGTATVTYSNDGGATYNYVPAGDGTGHDPAITNFRLLMDGVMNANQAAHPSFSIQYQVQVQ